MNKLSIFVLLTVAVCSCYGMADRRSIRSPSEVSVEADPITADLTATDDQVAEASNVFTGMTGSRSQSI